MLDGAEIDAFDQDGYNILTLSSTCRLTTYQGVFVDPSADGSDTEGTDRVREVILAGYEQDEDLRSEPVDPVDVGVVAADSQIEMAGLRVSVRRDGKDLVDTFYYRGMPTADATVFMALSCEQQIIDAGDSEMEQILDQISLTSCSRDRAVEGRSQDRTARCGPVPLTARLTLGLGTCLRPCSSKGSPCGCPASSTLPCRWARCAKTATTSSPPSSRR